LNRVYIMEMPIVLFKGGTKMKTKMPINRIKIGGNDILNIDLDQGWEITDVDFDDGLPSYRLNELVVTFRKTGKGLDYKQEVEIVRE